MELMSLRFPMAFVPLHNLFSICPIYSTNLFVELGVFGSFALDVCSNVPCRPSDELVRICVCSLWSCSSIYSIDFHTSFIWVFSLNRSTQISHLLSSVKYFLPVILAMCYSCFNHIFFFLSGTDNLLFVACYSIDIFKNPSYVSNHIIFFLDIMPMHNLLFVRIYILRCLSRLIHLCHIH